MKKIIYFILVFIFLAGILKAQYSGGTSDGYSKGNDVYYCIDFQNVKPSLLLPVNAVALSDETIFFTCEPIYTAKKYELQISTDRQFNNLFLDTLFEQNSIALTGFQSNISQYYWRIRANDSVNNCLWSDVWKFAFVKGMFKGGAADGYMKQNTPFYCINFVRYTPKILLPKDLSIFNNSSVNFSWEQIYTAKTYQLQIAEDAEFSNLAFDTTITNNTILINDLQSNVDIYYWRIRANDSSSNCLWSEVRKFGIVKGMFKGGAADGYSSSICDNSEPNNYSPNLISPLNLEIITTIFPYFDWEYIWNASSYHFQIAQDDGFSDILVNNENLINSDFQLNNTILVIGNTYYWRVRTLKNSQYSIWSDVWSFSIESRELLSKPQEYAKSFIINYANPNHYLNNEVLVRDDVASLKSNSIYNRISLNEGWNDISFSIVPVNNNLNSIFKTISEKILLIKNDKGKIFAPKWGLNQIGEMNYLNGYQIQVQEDCSLLIFGDDIKSKEIYLSKGWNLLPILSEKPIKIELLKERLGDNLIKIKDLGSSIFNNNSNGIFELLPNKAYWIYVKSDSSIKFP
ncbi:MAG TPA: hypothetical protein PKY56_04580 [Candidatus Kapabacteria bacterium]|nr:hypothetical protein [Candidatus Kapabacteria bacterium]